MKTHPAMTSLPSPELLRELLDYDPKTGVLTWRPRTCGDRPHWWNQRYAGTTAGTLCPDGNMAVKIFDRSLMAHRVIWAMVHGTWPECVIHRNGNLSDNRLRNLRGASRKVVQRRPVMYRHNRSGIRGVCWATGAGKWLASIRIDDFQVHLGLFDSKEEAAKARRRAERKRDRLGY